MANMAQSVVERCQEWATNLIDETQSSSFVQEAKVNPKATTVVIGALCCTLWLLSRMISVLKTPAVGRPATPDLEKPAARSFKAPARKPGS